MIKKAFVIIHSDTSSSFVHSNRLLDQSWGYNSCVSAGIVHILWYSISAAWYIIRKQLDCALICGYQLMDDADLLYELDDDKIMFN